VPFVTTTNYHLFSRYDAPSPGNTPPPDLTKDHIMDEHMDLSDGETHDRDLVSDKIKSSRKTQKTRSDCNEIYLRRNELTG
jgi:hypothetical protein